MDKRIGLKIKEARQTAQLNQIQLSKFLGIDQSNLSKIESDERTIEIVNLKKIANLFSMSLLDFQSETPIYEKLNLSFKADNIVNLLI
ncbi:MAG: helix-turn-helix transcriptional regulator [Sphaerochaetaceae bacterium]